nr:hypothetical protein [Leisingera aquaemixtae]
MKRSQGLGKGRLHLLRQRQRLPGRILAGQRRVEQNQEPVAQKPLQRAARLINQRPGGLVKGVERRNHLFRGNRTGKGGEAPQVCKQNRHGAALAVQQGVAVTRVHDHRRHRLRQETAQPVGSLQLGDLMRHLALQLAVPGPQLLLLRIDLLVQRAQLPAHAVRVPGQPAEFIPVGNSGPGSEIAGGDCAQRAADLLHRPEHGGGDRITRQQRQQDRGHAGPDDQSAGTRVGLGGLLRAQVHPPFDVLGDCIGIALQTQGDRGELLFHQFGNTRRAAGPPGLRKGRCGRRQSLRGPLQCRQPLIPGQVLKLHLPRVAGNDDGQVIGFIQRLGQGQPHAARGLGRAGHGKHQGVACALIDAVIGCDLLLIADQLPGPLIGLQQRLQPQQRKHNHQAGSGQKGGQQLVPQRNRQTGHCAHQKIRLLG